MTARVAATKRSLSIRANMVCHGCGEYARGKNSNERREIHVNTMESFWSLLRSRLRPHRRRPGGMINTRHPPNRQKPS
jgi:hypothetical protein